MFVCRSTALAVFISLVATGCARIPLVQPVTPQLLAAVQPVDVKLGIHQSELYAVFTPSTTGVAGAAACGAVPGIGILLAAACGGALGAVDAGINTKRAKAAEESVRPLKDELVALEVDQLVRESLKHSLASVPGMQLAGVEVVKTVTNEAYEKAFRASTSNAVMFVTVDYHLGVDFSTLELSARGVIYPRGNAARVAAAQPVLPATPPSGEPILALKDAVYRASIIYEAKLPKPNADAALNIAAWKADDGRLLRSAMQDGIAKLGPLLAEDLQRAAGVAGGVVTKVAVDKGVQADLVSQGNDGKLLRYPDGSLHFNAILVAATSVDGPVAKAEPAGAIETAATVSK